jgi:hypothetical protein
MKPASGDPPDDAPDGGGDESCATPGVPAFGWTFWARSSSFDRMGDTAVVGIVSRAPLVNLMKNGPSA